MNAATTRTPTLPPAWFKHAFWRVHRGLYRLSGGRFLWTPASKRGWGALGLATTGWKSGRERTVIVGYIEDGTNLVTLAMNGWDEGHPAWLRNLEAHPDVVVRLAHQRPLPVRARLAAGEERARLWRRWAEIDVDLDAYAQRRSIETPVVVLEPRTASGALMRAAVVRHYGPPEVARVAQMPQPRAPRADEVLVRVKAAAVTAGDSRIRGARFPRGFGLPARLAFGVVRPRRPILGSCFSGIVEIAGSRSGGFVAGDEVCGMTGIKMGAHAEFVVVTASRLTRKPSTVTHEDAAGLLFGGTAALFFLRDKTSVGPGMSVLVNGASGAVGTNAVQLAKHFGACVTGVTSAANAALVADLGAERIIDYTEVDLRGVADRFDVVLDTVGNLSIATGRRLLTPTGKLVLAVASMGETIRARRNVVAGSAPERVADVAYLLDLVVNGAITVVRDQTYDLDDIAAAYRRVDSGHKVGSVVVRP